MQCPKCRFCCSSWQSFHGAIQDSLSFNKKLTYCCDSRSYCMQYFNAIHCDPYISTSE